MGKFVARPRNVNWSLWQSDDGRYANEQVLQAILMDIRDELQTLNSLLSCGNFLDIPHKLERIARQTKRRKRPAGKPKLRVVR